MFQESFEVNISTKNPLQSFKTVRGSKFKVDNLRV